MKKENKITRDRRTTFQYKDYGPKEFLPKDENELKELIQQHVVELTDGQYELLFKILKCGVEGYTPNIKISAPERADFFNIKYHSFRLWIKELTNKIELKNGKMAEPLIKLEKNQVKVTDKGNFLVDRYTLNKDYWVFDFDKINSQENKRLIKDNEELTKEVENLKIYVRAQEIAVDELTKEVENLTKENENLKNKVNELEERLKIMENKMKTTEEQLKEVKDDMALIRDYFAANGASFDELLKTIKGEKNE